MLAQLVTKAVRCGVNIGSIAHSQPFALEAAELFAYGHLSAIDCKGPRAIARRYEGLLRELGAGSANVDVGASGFGYFGLVWSGTGSDGQRYTLWVSIGEEFHRDIERVIIADAVKAHNEAKRA